MKIVQDSVIRVRINAALLDRARQRAANEGMTISEFMRASVRAKLALAA